MKFATGGRICAVREHGQRLSTLYAEGRFSWSRRRRIRSGPPVQVLAQVGTEGLSLGEIVRRMQQQGLRDMTRSSKTPEASIGGALARDAVFWKTAPATFALQTVVAFHRRSEPAPTPPSAVSP